MRKEFQPDLWEQLTSEPPPLDLKQIDAIDNTPFSEAEVKQIQAGLAQLEARINEESVIPAEQKTLISSELKYLSDAAPRLKRKDWIHIALVALPFISITLVLAGVEAVDYKLMMIALLQAVLPCLPDGQESS